MNITVQSFRQLSIKLLDDDNGISQDAWDDLSGHLRAIQASDILEAVDSSDGRFYLNENHGITA